MTDPVSTRIDPRTPVVIGAGQINDRHRESEPIDLMARCTDAAITDTGSPGVRDRIDAVRVVWGVWPYRDPGRLLAARLGVGPARTTLTTMGGNQVYDLLGDTAAAVLAGRCDVAVIAGAETLRTRRADHAAGRRSPYLAEPDDAAPDEVLGSDRPLATDTEREIGVEIVARFYAMAETALRHRLGEEPVAHLHRIAELWARAGEVAAHNPHAWVRDAPSAERIATIDDGNRPVSSPYPKLLTSNLDVDQGGAVVVAAAEVADSLGVPRDRWVFPWAGSGAADHWFPTNRWAFDESPAMAAVGRDVLARSRRSVADVELLDLYSCFPVAVQVAQRELGIDPARPFTITGGLTFAAGPLNCYCLLPLTRVVTLLRERPDAVALLTGNGGSFSKHSAVVLGGVPPSRPFSHGHPQTEVDALPSRPTPGAPVPVATLETYTVTYDRDRQPEQAIAACLDGDGRRHWARSSDPSVMHDLVTADRCGVTVDLDGDRFTPR